MYQPGMRILLQCLRRTQPAEDLESINQLTPREWRSVIALAGGYGLTPLLAHRARQRGIVFPDGIDESLRNATLENTARNMLMYQELGRLLHLLDAKHITVILLKGAFLAEAVYNAPGLRKISDVDLLVSRDQLQDAFALLRAEGYETRGGFTPGESEREPSHVPELTKNGMFIDLHWTIAPEGSGLEIDPVGIWDRAQKFHLQGVETSAPGLSDLLLHLAVHAAYGHQLHYQLRTLYDLDEILSKFGTDLDWEQLIRICRSWHAERGVYLVFRLLTEMVGTPLAGSVLDDLQPGDWDERQLEWGMESMTQSTPLLSDAYIRLMQDPNPLVKVSALLTSLFPSRRVMVQEYGISPGSWKLAAMYSRHIAGRIRKYRGHAAAWLRGDRQQEKDSTRDRSLRDWLGIK